MIGVTQIGQSFDTLFKSLRSPATVISSIIMLCAMVRRPGLSCMISTSNILQDIAKKGCPTEPLPDGSPNLMNELVASVICEVYRALKEDANIQISLGPGAFGVTVTGGNAGGPMTSVGTNTTAAHGVGLLQ